MPLEPIEEKDLDLEGKFGGRAEGVSEKKETSELPEKEEKPRELSLAEKANAYNKILAKVKAAQSITFDPNAVSSDAQSVYQQTDAGSQVSHLVDLAETKGVAHAVKVAQHLEDNYVLDMFHDKLLSDELYDALVKKGLIKEI